jgi:hypothetical protein
MGQDDDYGDRDVPRLLEPENLVPVVVIAAVGGLLAYLVIADMFR